MWRSEERKPGSIRLSRPVGGDRLVEHRFVCSILIEVSLSCYNPAITSVLPKSIMCDLFCSRDVPIMGDSVLISVVEPGMLTTVQDVGRFGQSRFGVAPGGALDRRALVLGNRVLGNPADAACLEISLVGPKLAFTDPTIISLTGADLGTRLNGAPVSRWEPIAIAEGDEISFDPAGSVRELAHISVWPEGSRSNQCWEAAAPI